jgi:putative transcriptional regulator
MAIVRYTRDPNNPARFTNAELARLDAMTPEEIEQNAIDDPDNPPMTDDELERGVLGREVRLTRKATGLSQARFAERYRINVRRLQDIEIGRNKPDSAFMAYMRVIRTNPALVDEALREPV